LLLGSEISAVWTTENGTIGTAGTTITAAGWTNIDWDTFSTSGGAFTASKNVAGGLDRCVSTNTISATLDKFYEVVVDIASATIPYTVSISSGTNSRGTAVEFTGAGVKKGIIRATPLSGNFTLSVATATVGSISLTSATIREINSDNVVDPLGGNTAATAIATSADATFIQPVSTRAWPHTFSVWLRRKTGTGNIDITCNNADGWVTQSITASWQRYSVTQTVTGTIANCGIRISTSGDEIEVWGPQLTALDVLTDYQPTSTSALYGWSKSNVTVAKDQTGVDGVANACTSITATADNAVLIQPISLASGSRTGSVYLKRITGTGNVQVSLDGTTYSTVDLSTTEWRRIVLSGTVTNPTVGIKLAVSGDAVAMDYGQVEDGAFATTPILTTTATATRSADVATISGAIFNGFYKPTQTTVIVYGVCLGVNTDHAYVSLNGRFSQLSNTVRLNQYGGTDLNVTASLRTLNKIASSVSNYFSVFACNGVLSLNNPNQPQNPTVYTVMGIGNLSGTSNFLNGYVNRVVFLPFKSNQNKLVEITR